MTEDTRFPKVGERILIRGAHPCAGDTAVVLSIDPYDWAPQGKAAHVRLERSEGEHIRKCSIFDRDEWQRAPEPQTCRVCGCTDDDCSACARRTGVPCHWVEPDLCSACVTPAAATAKRRPRKGARR